MVRKTTSRTRKPRARATRSKRPYRTADYPVGYPGESIISGIKNALVRTPQPVQQQTQAQPPAGSQRRKLQRRTRPAPQVPQNTRQQRPPLVRPTPEEQLANRMAGNEPLRSYRQQIPNPLASQQKAQSYLERLENLTPERVGAGIKKYAPIVWKKAVRGAQDIDKSLEDYKARKKEEAIHLARQKANYWASLTPEERTAILERKEKELYMKEELRRRRSQYDQYAADRTIASLQGERWQPRVFKVNTGANEFGFGGETKYVDEYGREVPEPAGEVFPKRSKSTKRSEVSDIENLFGASYNPKPASRRETLPAEDDGGMVETGSRRRQRYTEPSPQRTRRSENKEIYDLFR